MTLQDKLALLGGVDASAPPYDTEGAGYAGFVPGNPRLCIPPLALNDGGAGVADGQTGTTAFPAPIAQAATWDTALQQRLGEALGAEAWGKGVDVLLAPDVNIARVPENGRNFEAFGEDPFLSAQTAVAEIAGIQSNPVIATVKHYPVNSQETNRYWVASIVDDRTLHEIYLPPFEAAVRQAHVGAVMCAYGLVDSAFSCQAPDLLTTVLRRELGFGGFVVSDWGATMSSAEAMLSGLDMQMPVATHFGGELAQDVASGVVPEAAVDTSARRILTTMFRIGVFDRPPPPRAAAVSAVVTSSDHRRIALRTAEEGSVLLKNEDAALPLETRGGKIAVIGVPAAPETLPQFISGGGSAYVAAATSVSPLAGLEARAARNGDTIVYADGSDPAAAAAVAGQASVAIVFAYDVEREGLDRPNLSLPDQQDALIDAVARANSHTVVVLDTGGPVLMPWLDEVSAVLETWYPGQQDGSAVAALLFGDVDPSGRLPQTFPAADDAVPTSSPDQWPGANDAQDAFFSEGLEVGYRWYDREHVAPLFPFGFGLSYTRFRYGNLSLTRRRSTVTVSFTVRNAGTRAGAEVAQVYVADPQSAGEPPRQLKGYARVPLKPGRSTRVRLTLPPRAFARWSTAARRWTIVPGTYGIVVAGSSRDIRLQARVRLSAASLAG